MLKGKMKEKPVLEVTDLRCKGSVPEKHLKWIYDEKEMIPKF